MKTNEGGVSPVVGVMLMLVVTIIIAAVVSAFAGGLGGDNTDPVTLKISGVYSQSDGFTFTHMGGDPISTQNTKIVVSTTDQFGTSIKRWEPNTSVVQILKNGNATPWRNVTHATISLNSLSFEPGEVAYVNVEDLGQVQPVTYTADAKATELNGLLSDAMYYSTTSSTTYGFLVPQNQGKQFLLQLINKNRVIAETKVKITP